MNQLLAIGIFAAGVVLIVYGAAASDSLSSDISRAFTGSPNDRTMWLLGGGAALAAVGGYGLTRRNS